MNKKEEKLFNKYKSYSEKDLEALKENNLTKISFNKPFINEQTLRKLQKREVTLTLACASFIAGCAILNFYTGHNTTGIITTGMFGFELSLLTKPVRKKINDLFKHLLKLESKKCIANLSDIEKVEQLRKFDLEK